MNTTMKPHQTQKIVTKNSSLDPEDELQKRINNLTHHHQTLVVIHSQQEQTISTYNFLRFHRKTHRNKTPRSIITRATLRKPGKDKTKHGN